MSSQAKHSEEPSTLPPPELNPLLNPLLADHMGRWAQVYFTSPPEKRDQAVQELLRELEAEVTRGHTIAASQDPAVVTPSLLDPSSTTPLPVNPSSLREQAPPASPPSEVQPTLVRCHACGRKSPSSQKFCGMCGTRLGEEAATDLHRDELHGGRLPGDDRQIADLNIEDEQAQSPPREEPDDFVQNQQSDFVPRDHDVNERRLNTNELSLFQSIRNDGYNDDYSDEIFSTPQGSGSKRFYVGIVLAIVIGALAYMAWRGWQSTSQSSQGAPLAAPTASPEPATSPAPPIARKSDAVDRATSKVNQAPDTSQGKPEPVRNEATTRARRAAQVLPHGTSRPEKTPAAEIPTGGTGGEELALAQRYLNGTNGQGRNSAEAARWLWRAMAKHNANAPLLLSDLYLKGDGVSKNCDQARVLLDAAAIRGVKDAGQRLRHLQAFGCQ